jgi:hypothetical protein
MLRTQYQNTEDPKTCSQDDCLPGEERPMFRRKVGKAVGAGDRKSFWIQSTLEEE